MEHREKYNAGPVLWVKSQKSMWQIFVPCNYNDGTPVRTRHHREWDRQVRVITGGLTILTPGKGQWVAPSGELFVDRMIPVQVMATHADMERVADITIRHYEQEAVLYYMVAPAATIRHATDEQKAAFTRPVDNPEPIG